MSKLSKQEKFEIYNLWKNYHIGPKELSQRYGIRAKNISYLAALIDRYDFSIFNKSYTAYAIEFKEHAIKRVIVNHESIYSVSLDLGLKSPGTLAN